MVQTPTQSSIYAYFLQVYDDKGNMEGKKGKVLEKLMKLVVLPHFLTIMVATNNEGKFKYTYHEIYPCELELVNSN